MGDETPSSDSSTRWVETSRGILRFSELAPLLAEKVLRVQQRIEAGDYSSSALDEDLLGVFHRDFAGDLFPEWGGTFRTVQVRVGMHEPPAPYLIRAALREYIADLAARLSHLKREPHDLPELFAFTEGRLLSIHPFLDFNGRVTRLWLSEVLRRLDLPLVDLAPLESARAREYLLALRAADAQNWELLRAIWVQRFAHPS